MRTGTADLPLHGGRAPRWLFERMTLLAREMVLAILSEEGTPGLEIEAACWTSGQEAAPLIRANRLSAKVDSAAVQDGFQIYHHSFFFTTEGSWAVVQQGMNEGTGMARRYHWLPPERFDSDPHAGIAGKRTQLVLNLVASEGESNRSVAVALARVLLKSYEGPPADYTALMAVPGVGAKALRALALVAELTYGEPASVRDPVSYAFAHGGKDGTPFPVDRPTCDATIESLRRAVTEAKAGHSEKSAALKPLAGVERSLTAVS